MSTVWNPETLVGTRLGSCVLQRPLGQGGMGAVYLAQQERPRRLVAVKVLRPQLSDNRRAWSIFLARFQREADATAALDHGNIVPIYEFGEQDGTTYLVMPYLPDGSLADLLAREGPLPLDRTLAYIGQTAAALDYAHAHGIVHRDVKPSNLLLHPDGRLLLADFGIARPLDRAELPRPATGTLYEEDEDDSPTLTRDGAVMGTPHFMAPEQIRGEAVGPATDVYALAALAYTMLTGELPFGEGPYGEVLRRQLLGRAAPLRKLRPDLPARVDQTVMQALNPDPATRPATAAEFAQALRSAGRNRTLGDATTIGAAPQGARGAPVRTSALRPAAHDPFPAHEAPTVFDAPALSMGSDGAGGQAGVTPEWPGGGGFGGNSLAVHDWGDAPRRPRRGVIALGVIATLLLTILFAGVLSSLASGVLAGLPFAGAGATPAATHVATVTPLPTATPSPTATPVTDWLRVSPASVTLGCRKSSKATVTLTNLGPEDISWNSTAPWFGGVSVSPTSGQLDSGEHTTVTISNTSFFLSNRGVITFSANDARAGASASVSYETTPC